MIEATIAGEFTADDYSEGFACTGKGRVCGADWAIVANGVWLKSVHQRTGRELLVSAHRQCVQRERKV
ncbi:hypothetical protein I5G97_gp012 [Mycobacterium phage Curiosium]|uniref:Uncharacterized protein n=1 Tax=Mycobacterium phage Curiosium TaxID=2599859 RepID=A0A5J6TTP7_9CAUD|nr:hypothetical protein I5G97_gp012 [Mycobacterium phage Curiosium]QFG14141.1 hypothetical protein PBI_CURIOSIUM_98 [Mycobacterium phage Curiosium]